MEATLVGALRREKMAETAVRKLEAEIEQVNHLVYLLHSAVLHFPISEKYGTGLDDSYLLENILFSFLLKAC